MDYQEAKDYIEERLNKSGWTSNCADACEMMQELVDKATPKKVIVTDSIPAYYCPACRSDCNDNYCGACGQRLDWSNVNE